MLHNEKRISGYTIHATDDELGKTDAFLFDDEKWVIRYLAVDTRKWLPGRKVLISPISISKISHSKEYVGVNLTKQQVKDSPSIDTDQPLSREQEMKMNQFFDWGNSWGAPGIWGTDFYPSHLMGQEMPEWPDENPEEVHLRRTSELQGYKVIGKGEEAGEAESFVIDDQSWRIRYIVVKMDGDKLTLINPEWVTRVSWADKEVHVATTKNAMQNAPAHNPLEQVKRSTEEQTYKAHGRNPDW